VNDRKSLFYVGMVLCFVAFVIFVVCVMPIPQH